MSRVSVVKYPSYVDSNSNVLKDEGQFTFSNGDTYTGGFRLEKGRQFVARQGHGLYLTEDFNEYEAYWSEDRIVGEARIRYNNGTQYKGRLDIDGRMFGSGAYTFLDDSVLRATWLCNKPTADITMKEHLTRSIWNGASNGKVIPIPIKNMPTLQIIIQGYKEVALTVNNHFWDEIGPSTSDGSEDEEETQLEVNLDQ